ncbi:LysR substrate-binding domain-containing protein [Paenibacillus sp. GXUN7292]|uniref:LysR substrate-binding domain-containing protein n=1 Tax=Paenibacillus sp. GXUN7292 TaxID=3422499 RepID=UPI003D7D4C03
MFLPPHTGLNHIFLFHYTLLHQPNECFEKIHNWISDTFKIKTPSTLPVLGLERYPAIAVLSYLPILHTKLAIVPLELENVLGKGISFISRIAVANEVERGLLLLSPLPNPLSSRSIYVIYHRDRWRSAQMRTFLDMLTYNQKRSNLSDLGLG